MTAEPQSRHNNAVCARCARPIGWTSKREEPTICGPCHHAIHDEAGAAAVRAYMEGIRAAA